MSAGRKLIFLHIPKTGGSTLRKIIDRQYRSDETARCYYQKQGIPLRRALAQIRSLPAEQAAKVKIILGHVGYGIHHHLPWSCSYIALLRDPVDRVISGYYHIRRDSLHPLHEQVQKMSLKDYVTESVSWFDIVPRNAVNALDNTQTRLLSGSIVATELSAATDYGRCDEKMLERAKENLKDFVGIGISDRFDQSLILLKQMLGWSNVYYVPANVGWNKIRKEELAKDVLAAVEKNNEFDIELYNFVRQDFEDSIKRQGLLFQTKAGTYRLLNRTYNGARRIGWALEKRVFQKTN